MIKTCLNKIKCFQNRKQLKLQNTRHLMIETINGRYFHETKVKAMLNTVLNCTINDAASAIIAIAKAEKINLK